jgi:hypothetical protein
MEIVAFISFAVLVFAWLIAPTGEPKVAPEVEIAPSPLKVGDAVA